MKCIVVFFLCATLATIASGEEMYSDQYDSVDIDEILNSDRLLSNYFNCLKTGQKCTPDGQKLREILPDALRTKCQKCSEAQNKLSKKVISFLVNNKKEMFLELEIIFDPEHKYRESYAEELKKDGIVLPN
ncbi:hypothetical protein FQA39_LY10779 [Lamprigera yunnana]|nr:hypothetical protein FQA39_LY10779 [Lamprigera yunnana]